MISDYLLERYFTQGYIHLRSVIPLDTIYEIRNQIADLIVDQTRKIEKYKSELLDGAIIDSRYLDLRNDLSTAKRASFVYDGIKKIPLVAQLSSSQIFEDLAKVLMKSDRVGFAPRGYGIRIDTPNDKAHLTPLHQDYHTNMGSVDGITFYCPLFSLDLSTGPLIVYPTSHKLGLLSVERATQHNLSTDLVPMISNSDLEQFKAVQPNVEAGDTLALNNLTLHQSGFNNGTHSRWTLISRWFNLKDQGAIARGYKCGVNEGVNFEDEHPDLINI
jgi:hypothetical protein